MNRDGNLRGVVLTGEWKNHPVSSAETVMGTADTDDWLLFATEDGYAIFEPGDDGEMIREGRASGLEANQAAAFADAVDLGATVLPKG